MKISRRQATIGGVTLLAGISMGTSAQAQRDRPLKRAIEDVKEREEVRSAERLKPKELASRMVYRRAVDGMPAFMIARCSGGKVRGRARKTTS